MAISLEKIEIKKGQSIKIVLDDKTIEIKNAVGCDHPMIIDSAGNHHQIRSGVIVSELQ